ncbi:MAG: exodeoxyribonuclease VII small subunit [Betaproteobacteria bacterium]|jgi:exodeoxyribonuclease VII small subunit|nr:exodeoxyribonuclease VII small subunit [Betaproteobacteria bacterium]
MEKKHTAKAASALAASAGVDSRPPRAADTGGPAGLPDDISALNFEQAMSELEQVTRRLEQGDVPIAEALSAYQRGASLMRHAQAILNHVQTEIEVIEAGQERSADRSALISQIKE